MGITVGETKRSKEMTAHTPIKRRLLIIPAALALVFLAWLMTMTIYSPIRSVRIRVVKQEVNHQRIEDIAKSHWDSGTRIAAINKTKNDELLAGILTDTKDTKVIEAALLNIESPIVLKNILKSTGRSNLPENLKLLAANRISDETLLASVILESNDPELSLQVLKQFKSPLHIANIAANSSQKAVSLAAVGMLEDEESLKRVVMVAKAEETALAALAGINDQSFLVSLVREHSSFRVRDSTLRKIVDQNALAEVTVSAKNDFHRTAAVEAITDDSIISRLAQSSDDSDVRRKAVSKVSDQAILAEIALHERWRHIRDIAFDRIKDQSVRVKVICEDPGHYGEALKDLTETSAILYAALNGEYEIRKQAAAMLTDEASLAEVYCYNNDSSICGLVLEKIESPSLLMELAARKGKAAPLQKLRDDSELEQLAGQSSDPSIKLMLNNWRHALTLSQNITSSRYSGFPKEGNTEKYRQNRATEFMEMLMAINREPVLAELGALLDFNCLRHKLYKEYIGPNMTGETLVVRAQFANVDQPIEGKWFTDFERTERFEKKWKKAKVSPNDFYETVYQQLTEAALLKLSMDGSPWGARYSWRAAKLLKSQAALADVATSSKAPGARDAATKKLTNPEVIALIARNDEAWWVRARAVKMLDDEQLLLDRCLTDPAPQVRVAALGLISDRNLLEQAVMAYDPGPEDQYETSIENPFYRQIVESFDCIDQMEQFATTAVYWRFRMLATWKLPKNHPLLLQIALKDTNREVRRAARDRITDTEMLRALPEKP